MKDDFVVITTTVEKENEANELAAYMVRERLGACVSVRAIESFYMWQGELASSKEFEVSIKTLKRNYKKIKKAIANNSKYELPQILVFPILQGEKEYIAWMKDSLD
ncbi:MAG: divalent-cation tolerance protein CutA [Wolinella sp.]